VGALAVAVVAAPFKVFELDRFFVPKELVLHATAALALLWAIVLRRGADGGSGMARPWRPTAVDLTLALYLLLSVASAAVATNHWLATRALAVTLSGAGVFWAARALARRGLAWQILAGAAAAIVVAVGTALLQAYGVRTEYFSLNRAPGGTFGNRNFVAHLAAIGIPLVVAVGVRARRVVATLLAGLGLAMLIGMLVLSRTRAAYLGAMVAMVPLALGFWRARTAESGDAHRLRYGRVTLMIVAAAAGAAAAVLLPNTLKWNSDSPYLDSVKGVVDYKSGSGGGRLKQWRNSARMLAAKPVTGVGPGNWPVRYPRYAPDGDPSLTDDGMTSNPWPSSDWVAVASERGLAVVPLLAVFALLAWRAHLAVWRRRSADEALVGGVLGSLLAATAVVGMFDAVLLLAAPTLIVWPALGALAEECRGGVPREGALVAVGRSRVPRRLVAGALATVSAVAAVRSAGQWGSMALFSTGRVGDITQAGRLDPGSYRVRLRLAELAARRGQCTAVRAHAGAARSMFPEASAPRRLLARCPAPRERSGRGAQRRA
jgi:O-antigen ligase